MSCPSDHPSRGSQGISGRGHQYVLQGSGETPCGGKDEAWVCTPTSASVITATVSACQPRSLWILTQPRGRSRSRQLSDPEHNQDLHPDPGPEWKSHALSGNSSPAHLWSDSSTAHNDSTRLRSQALTIGSNAASATYGYPDSETRSLSLHCCKAETTITCPRSVHVDSLVRSGHSASGVCCHCSRYQA